MTRRRATGLLLASVAAAALIASFAAPSVESGSTHSEDDEMAIIIHDDAVYSKSGYDITPLSRERVEELAERLSPEQYRVTQRGGTEQGFCGSFLHEERPGSYLCAVCGLPLFRSEHKFDSETGWPSFFLPYDPDHVGERVDRSYGMVRSEIFCTRCNAHLGHVFPDGPPPTGRRYCLNSAALDFVETEKPVSDASGSAREETAFFAGGCFWSVEYAFSKHPGVIDVVSGYQNGNRDHPTYEEVCSDRTGHAEAVRVTYDPARTSYEELVRFFFKIHDPTQIDRQGPDVGTQYRSAIFTNDADQRAVAERVKAELAASDLFGGRRIVTRIEPAETFWEAEEEHQDYNSRTGRVCHVNVKAVLASMGIDPN